MREKTLTILLLLLTPDVINDSSLITFLRANSTPRALKKRSDYYQLRFIVLLNIC